MLSHHRVMYLIHKNDGGTALIENYSFELIQTLDEMLSPFYRADGPQKNIVPDSALILKQFRDRTNEDGQFEQERFEWEQTAWKRISAAVEAEEIEQEMRKAEAKEFLKMCDEMEKEEEKAEEEKKRKTKRL